jgi:hypothetical protein
MNWIMSMVRGENNAEVDMRLLAGFLRLCFVLASGLSVLVAGTGCWVRGRQMPTGHSLTSGSVYGLSSTPDGTTPEFRFAQWKQGLSLLIVEDTRGSGEGEGDFYHYEFSAENDHGLRWNCRLDTRDGKTATCRINNKQFDLSQGALFVIKAKEDGVHVHQLKRDLSSLPLDGDAVREFLGNDAEVRKIFGVKDEEK